MKSSRRFAFIFVIILATILACGPGSKLTGTETPTPEPSSVEVTPPPATPAPQTVAPTDTPAPVSQPVNGDNTLPLGSVIQIWALDQSDTPMWTGSGSIIDSKGYILTNAHVALPEKSDPDVGSLLILFSEKEDEAPIPRYRARTLLADKDLDFAVLRIYADADGNPIDADNLDLPIIPLGNSDEIHLGAALRVLGYPGIGGETITLTTGEVAGFTSEDGVKGRAYIKTSAAIAGGNSGGAGIDPDGVLIGVPTQLGSGSQDDQFECRRLADTNDDGIIDENDSCISVGGFINALRPINLAKPLIARALNGEIDAPPPAEPERVPVVLPDNPGEQLFADDFSSDTGNWGLTDGIVFDGSQIILNVPDTNNYLWTTLSTEYDNIDFQVEGEKLGGPDDNSFGVIFRFQDSDNYYTYEVSSDGFYVVNKFADKTWTQLIEWSSSPLIKTGYDKNQIAVEMMGNHYSFFINGVQVDSITDDTFSGGRIGLIASSYSEPDVSVGFDNVLVRAPGGARILPDMPQTTETGSVIFQDDFSQIDTNWNLEPGDSVERNISNGEFTLKIIDTQTDAWSTYPLELGDVSIEVDARKASGTDVNNYGVMCRYQDPDNFYFLQMGSDGTYAITRYLNGENSTLVDWTNSPDVRKGDATNHIRVDCVGDILSLYANGTLLASVQDNNLASGKFALAAGTYDDGNVQINFDNLTVSSLGGQVNPAPQPAPVGDNLIFFDDFSDNSAEWPEQITDDASYNLSDGEYFINVQTPNYMVWARQYGDWGNATIDVDTRLVSGTDNNELGLICRYQDSDNFYQFSISSDGYYRLGKWVEGDLSNIVDWDTNDIIDQNTYRNHLTVVCNGDTLAMRVNGTELFSVSDSSLPASGNVAMYVGTFDDPDTTIAFDNFSVAQP